MPGANIDLAERQLLIASAEALIEKLNKDTPRCRNCINYWDEYCNKHKAKPPAHVLSTGCDDWQWNDLPF